MVLVRLAENGGLRAIERVGVCAIARLAANALSHFNRFRCGGSVRSKFLSNTGDRNDVLFFESVALLGGEWLLPFAQTRVARKEPLFEAVAMTKDDLVDIGSGRGEVLDSEVSNRWKVPLGGEMKDRCPGGGALSRIGGEGPESRRVASRSNEG